MSAGRRAYDMLRSYVGREWERIQDLEIFRAQQELESGPTGTVESPPPPPQDPHVTARAILGVPEGADFTAVRRAFERLNRRSDPTLFPEGSTEQIEAAAIQKRIQWAYRVLSENVDTAERRFRTLEIE